jgi:membrane protein
MGPTAKVAKPLEIVHRWGRILQLAGAGWARHDDSTWSAALAFHGLFSLAPTLLIATMVAGAVLGEGAADGRLDAELRRSLGDSGAQLATELVQHTWYLRVGWWPSLAGVVLILYGASSAVNCLKGALDSIWEVAARPKSRFWSLALDRLIGIAFILFVGVLLLASVVASTMLASATGWVDQWMPNHRGLRVVTESATTLALVIVLFAALFKFLPSVRLTWRDVWAGAALTGLLFAVGKIALGMYLGRTAIASTYGAAGAVVVILLWAYYSAQILLLGAEITCARARVLGRGPELRQAASAATRRSRRGRA